MNLLLDKGKEVAATLLPVIVLVMILSFTIVDVSTDVTIRFLVGSVLLLLGLSIFLWGVDLAMNPIGEFMSMEIATSKTLFRILGLSFLLGFLITVAEPDLLILGNQVQNASGDTLNAQSIVYMVSIGVGFMISLGVLRLLRELPLNKFMALTYGFIFILAYFVSEEFLAISFDASGATTGALTTPFVLALSLGLSRIKGGQSSEEDSFGLVGIMSTGPIIAVMLMAIITGQSEIQGEIAEFIPAQGIIGPILHEIPIVFKESLMALFPIALLFYIYNLTKFKIDKEELVSITKGLVFILVGLTLFLTSVNAGFMDMGRILGMEIAQLSKWILVGIGFLIGLIVVLVEPAVHVLGEQIEEVTAGYIPNNIIKLTLSLGVATAIALSMVRIVVPEVKLWFFLLPGFVLAIILSFIADKVFVGIAYDAGGVASGPMTATFVLAFAQGAATMTETANVLVDGFGVIAMVAMAPILSIMILGTAFRRKDVIYSDSEEVVIPSVVLNEAGLKHDCLLVVVNRGFAKKTIDVARQSGATGATVVNARGTDEYHKTVIPILNMELQPEKEIIMLVTDSRISEHVAKNILTNSVLAEKANTSIFLSHTEAMINSIVADIEKKKLAEEAANLIKE